MFVHYAGRPRRSPTARRRLDLASIVLSVFIGISNLVSIWLAAKLDLEGLNDGSA